MNVFEALVYPKQRHLNDQSTFKDLNWSRHSNDLPKGLSLKWLGTAGFELNYQGYSLLIDPYLSRRKFHRVLSSRTLLPDTPVVADSIKKADAIVVGHTHFDHVMDVPILAALNNCKVYGSESLRRLMAVYGLSKQSEVVVANKVYGMGPFEVTFIESLHSKLVLGLKVPMEGEICCEHLDHLNNGQYRCGQVFGIHIKVAGVSFYHQGSANLIDDNIRHKNVDYFLCGISGRGFTHRYTQRILQRLSPQIVIPHHFDNFFRSTSEPLSFLLNVNLGGFVEEVRQVSSEFEVRTVEMFGEVD